MSHFGDEQCDRKLKHDLTNAYHLAAQFNWDDLIYTHFSVRSMEDPNTYYINPFGLLFSEITPDLLLRVDLDGNIVSDNPYSYNPAGENIHGSIYKAREDVNAVIHIHTLNGMALSSLKEGLLPICQQSCHFYGRIGYHNYHGISVDKEEQESFLADLADNAAMILHNHGLLTVGKNVQEAFCEMNTLEKAATVQMMALASGRELVLPDKSICERVIKQTQELALIKNYNIEWDAMIRLLRHKRQERIMFFHQEILESDKSKFHSYDDHRMNYIERTHEYR